MLYRKKHPMVEAFKVGTDEFPKWFKDGLDTEEFAFHETLGAYIMTSNGVECVSIGDYIVKDYNGNIYSYNSDIFEEEYERVKHGGTYEIPLLKVKRFESDCEPVPVKVYPFIHGDVDGDTVFKGD